MHRQHLAIDIGNSSAKAGLFEGDTLLKSWSGLSDRQLIKMAKSCQPQRIVLCTVRKRSNKLMQALAKVARLVHFTYKTPLPVQILYHTPHTLGADRLAAVVGARHLFPQHSCLVIDVGTCITYDYLDAEGNYHGGGIAPGIDMRLRAMHKFTARLPAVGFSDDRSLVGKTTKEAMLSGAVEGTLAEVQGMIERYEQFFNISRIIICGGQTKFFETNLKGPIFAISNLVLIGLNQTLLSSTHED